MIRAGSTCSAPLAADVQAICRDRGHDVDLTFTRLAVTPEQIAGLGLPTAPPKTTDRRSFNGETTQVEAIPPDVLAKIIQQTLADRLDSSALKAVMGRSAHQGGVGRPVRGSVMVAATTPSSGADARLLHGWR